MAIQVYFYIPPHQWPDPVPPRYEIGWQGFGESCYNWTMQTYLMCREHNFRCHLVNDVSDKSGIIIAHRASLDEYFKAGPGQLLVCIQADWGRHPYAQAHICQNLAQTKREGRHLFYQLFWPGNTYFVHHWPQPNLIGRDQNRPKELNTLAYFGLDYNLAPELRSREWQDFLAELGIEWRLVGNMRDWGDFSEVDAVFCSRDFTGNPFYNKPATKLQNAWLAKCLPICTPESAFLQESKRDDLGTVYVDDFSSLKHQLKELKEKPGEFAKRIDAAASKGAEYTNQRIVNEWIDVITTLQEVDYPKFAGEPLRLQLFHRVRDVSVLLMSVMGKLKPSQTREARELESLGKP